MDLVGTALRNPINRAILQRLPLLGAPQCWLVAGCIYQAAWNERAGRTPQSDIKDYDIFYFDDADLSYEAEDAVIRRGRVLFADLDGLIEIRNQARVHLWYPERFGAPYPRLANAEDGIGRFLARCTCVGLAPQATAASGSMRPTGSMSWSKASSGRTPTRRAFIAIARKRKAIGRVGLFSRS